MDNEGTSLSDLLSDDEPVQTAVAEEPAGPARDEHGRFAQKGEEESASPAPVEEPPFEHAAVKGERSRRQAAEQERDTFRAELDALKQQFQATQQPKPAPAPDFWEDTPGWQQHFGGEVTRTAVQEAVFQSQLNMSEMMTRQANPDFDEIKAQFLALAEQNPTLREQALADPHPWNKAYQIAKNHKAMQELGATDLDTLKAKLREELMAEVQGQQPQMQRPGLPPTLANERNVGTRAGPAWSGPTPLSDMLG